MTPQRWLPQALPRETSEIDCGVRRLGGAQVGAWTDNLMPALGASAFRR